MQLIKRVAAVAALSVLAGVAMADPQCTKAPQDKWMDQAVAKQKIEDMGYKIKTFKVTKTHCYEIYGHDAAGKKVEIYFNPENLDKVKEED
ncbi:hypothetical protein WH50_13815 [Pokkaliibacter plantistimulans]|uniref:PepSY domain-containing protein n=1 Tax=Pokkaliibacter plantistimulans TaxID=1635171 RepID=A0ABX5M198_9GAMM|nr:MULTISPECIES: PepSY domain-containing protein [Pokkaliibacter]MDH2433460.1 PepSY domain-containing protein [Pokkaliibacter sp. MBI-7]PXF30675.1 hypothetical protein WH50_13815 [Pokkaliibacter plantistimulans]